MTSTETLPLRYAGFWARLAANLLDLVLFAPFFLLFQWGIRHARFYLVLHGVLIVLFGVATDVLCVGRWGGSPGKLIMGLRITDLEGHRVGFRALHDFVAGTVVVLAPGRKGSPAGSTSPGTPEPAPLS